MDKANIGQKSKKTLGLAGKALYYTEAIGEDHLKPGLYRPTLINIGEWVPAYVPVEVSNDRPLEVDDTIAEIVKESRDLFARRDIFKKMGFAHKRGYLLHGPPGCGKSSTLRLLEERFVAELKGIVLFWDVDTNIQLFYDHLREREGDRPIMVVCEDIDDVIEEFETSILEFLDGQRGLDNFILVATTNNLEKIPSRIKDRPSRIDRQVEIKKPNRAARFKYVVALGVDEVSAGVIADSTDNMSMAHVKEAVVATVCLGQDIHDVIKRLEVADLSPLDRSEG